MKEHKDLILELPNFVPQSLCKKMIQIFENAPNQKPGTVTYGDDRRVIPEQKISIDSCPCPTCIPEAEHEYKECVKFIESALELYKLQIKNEYEYKQKLHTFEQILDSRLKCKFEPSVQKQPKGGKYAWHYDWGDGVGHFVVIMIYLNTLEPDEGGCTEFGNGRKVRPECGKVVIWPATWAYPHCGNEVKGESKYTIVSSIHFAF